MTGYLTTIGLEIHVELATRTKLFCGCAVEFGGEPNSRVCPICLGHPGTLPVPNQKAAEYAAKIALALECEIAPRALFHRKNYFYPDMPKNYQISQYDVPVGSRGKLQIEVDGSTRTIEITRVHLEEDTGKSIHVGGGGRIHEAEYSLEDFNRAGTPLVEIVTEPELASPDEARAFVQELRSILEFLGVSDVRMEEGSLRVDANISVAPKGERGAKVEVKNMNSIRSLQRALVYEEGRQREALESGGALEQSTRHWDEEAGVTKVLRTKEHAFDYRYFPEPDLVPVEPSKDWLREVAGEIPELPAARRRRFVDQLSLTAFDASVLTSSRALSEFFEAAVGAARSADSKRIANWVVNDLLGRLAESDRDISSSRIGPDSLAALVDLVADGTISNNQAKQVLTEMLETGHAPSEIIADRGLSQVSDRSQLASAVEKVIADNAEAAGKVRGGDDRPLGFLVGQAMKATGGSGNPQLIREILLEALAGR